MDNRTIYSVVDLEATGPDVVNGDRIIQFSCTFVQDQKIINSFSTLINPLRPIDERITELTGITNQMVADAPTFKDVASLLYNMLRDTVFVAHNVNFDFPFINRQFNLIGYRKLPIKAIDTVTMSQILLPMLPSYQLRRISSYFNIIHKHPHSASSDALATAYLLILLINRLKVVPYLTLRGILRINPKLPRNTMEMFRSALKRRSGQTDQLPAYLMIKRGLVLRRYGSSHHRKKGPLHRYPITNRQKRVLYGNQLSWRPKQARMMNQIYQNFTRGKHSYNLIFEIATGSGRKIGYTLPLAYLSHNYQHTVIISTDTPILRKQLNNQTVPTLNAVLPFRISSLVIKDPANYIDLNRFFNTLRIREKSDQTQLVKAMVLVWLTITTTGDLSELHISSKIPYLKEIRHYQESPRRSHNPFYSQDFIRQLQKKSHRVNFVIVSHHYLCNHAKALSHLNREPYLVIDEADSLPASELSRYRFNIWFNNVNIVIREILSDIYRSHGINIRDILPSRFKVNHLLKRLDLLLNRIHSLYKGIIHRFSREFLSRQLLTPVSKHVITKPATQQLKGFFNDENSKFQIINQDVNQIDKISRYFESLSGKKRYRRINRLEMDNFYHHVAILSKIKDDFNLLISQIQMHPENCTFKCVTNEPHNVLSCRLIGGLINLGKHLNKDLYQYFRPVIFTDHALITDPKNLINSRLKVKASETREFSELSRITKAKPVLNVYQTGNYFKSPETYCYLLANLLLHKGVEHNQRLLTGFASRSLMMETYEILVDSDKLHEPVYAEGINGNRNRILKRLTNASKAIVLTSLSWFNALNLTFPRRFGELVIADLPFKLSSNLYETTRLRNLRNNQENVMKRYKLSKIILIIKRVLNYLPNHRNCVSIFDGRILNYRYLIPLKESLPKGIIISPRKVKIYG